MIFFSTRLATTAREVGGPHVSPEMVLQSLSLVQMVCPRWHIFMGVTPDGVRQVSFFTVPEGAVQVLVAPPKHVSDVFRQRLSVSRLQVWFLNTQVLAGPVHLLVANVQLPLLPQSLFFLQLRLLFFEQVPTVVFLGQSVSTVQPPPLML